MFLAGRRTCRDGRAKANAAAGDRQRPESARAVMPGQARGYPMRLMNDVLGLLELALYVIGILSLSGAITWIVVKVSPSASAKQQKAQEAPDT